MRAPRSIGWWRKAASCRRCRSGSPTGRSSRSRARWPPRSTACGGAPPKGAGRRQGGAGNINLATEACRRLCCAAGDPISWRCARRVRGGALETAMSDNDRVNKDNPTTGVVVKTKVKTKKPSMYKVLLLNDDYTPMEFVVHVLERFFNKNREDATQIMLHVHRRGVGVCGVYTYEVAETKVTQVIDFARRHEHPLQCTLEKE